MSQGKLEFSFGSLNFVGEGEEKWLAEQLDKVIKAAPDLSRYNPPASKSPESSYEVGTSEENGGEFTTSLANHIKANGGESNQTKRFLATADWLRRRGNTNLSTADIGKALATNHQKKIGNPADNLNKNVAKGFCEKTTDGFFITPEGLIELGYH